MSEIKEIPLEAEIPQEIEDQEIQEEPPKATAKGRPKGAKNKPKEKAAPAPKVKKAPAKKTKAPVYESEEESEEEEPVLKKRNAPPQVFQRGSGLQLGAEAVAPELDRRALAADVLQLLSEQKFNRASARRNHYASWFA